MTKPHFSPFYAFATFSRQCIPNIRECIMKADGGKPMPRWSGDCETMRLLGLEGEYLSFLLDTEVELGLLRHVLGCDACHETVKELISGDGQSDLGTIGKLFDDVTGVDFVELGDLVERRIGQRIEQLERLREDAGLELEDLRRNLEPLIHRDRG